MTGKEDLVGFNIQLYNMAMSISQIDSSLKETLWLLIDQFIKFAHKFRIQFFEK